MTNGASIERLILSESDLQRGSTSTGLASRMLVLLAQQKDAWPLLRTGYGNLDSVETREMEFGDVTIRLQFNPGRIISSSAKVDDASIRARPCFLCAANLPAEQRGFRFGETFLVLSNPYPIFREHFTIPHVAHTPQRIAGAFGTMCALAREVQSRYVIVYNGPRCGASAPDHLHLQAGEKDFMPIERESVGAMRAGSLLVERKDTRVVGVEDGMRRYFVIEGSAQREVSGAFMAVLEALPKPADGIEEVLINVIAGYATDAWRIIVIPRARHRPSVFFAEGEARILLSPAVIDCGGVCTVPREEDFRRLTSDIVRRIFDEIMITPGQFTAAAARIPGLLPS